MFAHQEFCKNFIRICLLKFFFFFFNPGFRRTSTKLGFSRVSQKTRSGPESKPSTWTTKTTAGQKADSSTKSSTGTSTGPSPWGRLRRAWSWRTPFSIEKFGIDTSWPSPPKIRERRSWPEPRRSSFLFLTSTIRRCSFRVLRRSKFRKVKLLQIFIKCLLGVVSFQYSKCNFSDYFFKTIFW